MIYQIGPNVYDRGLDKEENIHVVRMVQKLLVFKDLFGVSPNSANNIQVRKNKSGFEYAISLNDKFSINFEKGTSNMNLKPMSSLTLKTWFQDYGETPDTITRTMLLQTYSDSNINVANKIREEMELVIRRINPEYVWLSNVIYSRLISRLKL